jgi:cyclopropane-fatty-acyl-phospholipid synthase
MSVLFKPNGDHKPLAPLQRVNPNAINVIPIDSKHIALNSVTEKTTPTLVTKSNLKDVSQGLPWAVRQAFSYALRLQQGTLDIALKDGRVLRFKGSQDGPHAVFVIHDYRFARRLSEGGDIGFAEAYIQKEWDTPDLTAFLELFCANHSAIESLLTNRPWVRLWQRLMHVLNRNTKSGSKRNIHAHYDLGNAFYSAWLDDTMTYSAAVFAPGDNDLSSAQLRKFRQLAELTALNPNDHVLEIGCGWGGFATFAARDIGCKVTALTISQEQYKHTKKVIFENGLNDKVNVIYQDYRDEKGTYDKIISIEMFEAVGEQYWSTYFNTLRERLKEGGRAGLQVITIGEAFFDNYRKEIDFIRRYIFPGGMLPTSQVMQHQGAKVGLPLIHETAFGLDYAHTLAHWRERFREKWHALVPLGFDDHFRRMWEYYFAYCEAGFRSGHIDVRHLIYAKA